MYMYMCIYVYIYVYICVYMYICIYMYICVCVLQFWSAVCRGQDSSAYETGNGPDVGNVQLHRLKKIKN